MESDYYIETISTGVGIQPWGWELRRRSEPMGVKVGSSGYQSQRSAEFAGAHALVQFLEDLDREQRRK
jgi:hypothetical protein